MHDLPTPALVIDGAVLRKNIARMATYVRERRINLRPHTKTHKSRMIAAMQIASGAAGLTVAKAGEAEIMIGVSDDILMAYPPVERARCTRVAQLSRNTTLRVALDSEYAVDSLSQAASAARTTVGVLVDVDVGMHRTGVQTPEGALSLATTVSRSPGLRLDGIMYYPGHVWDLPDAQEPALRKVSERLEEVLGLWSQHGLLANIVSGGSTPTAFQSHLIGCTTEIRPGTYVFNDMNTLAGGFCGIEDCAARIVCTVVSTAISGQFVIDGGTKTFTSDRCIPAPETGHGYIVEYPDARLKALSEEHGQVDISRSSTSPRVGDRVTVIPNHICPCINLQDFVWLIEPDSTPERLSVDARGKLS
jgi:D-serine deaminase-like pyridoxal phosphate-dependent protein